MEYKGMEVCDYENRRKLRLAKLEEVLATDYLETVMCDIGFDPRLKRFERVAQCVRLLGMQKIGERMTATKLYQKLGEETGEAPRWIGKQITLAIAEAYKSGKIKQMNTYARYELIETESPIGNYLMVCELLRILMLRAIELLYIEG